MVSPWRNPLPLEEYATNRVVVYFYNGRWIPIMFYNLADAIALARKASQEGKEILVFPSDLNPYHFWANLAEENANSSNDKKTAKSSSVVPFPHSAKLAKMVSSE